MSVPRRGATPATRVARLVHGGLVLGVVATALALTGIGLVMDGHLGAQAIVVLRIVAGLTLVVVATAVQVVKRRLPPVASGTDPDLWWMQAMPPAVVVWALAEGATVIGGVLWLVSGDLAVFLALLGAGLVILLINRPGELVRER